MFIFWGNVLLEYRKTECFRTFFRNGFQEKNPHHFMSYLVLGKISFQGYDNIVSGFLKRWFQKQVSETEKYRKFLIFSERMKMKNKTEKLNQTLSRGRS